MILQWLQQDVWPCYMRRRITLLWTGKLFKAMYKMGYILRKVLSDFCVKHFCQIFNGYSLITLFLVHFCYMPSEERSDADECIHRTWVILSKMPWEYYTSVSKSFLILYWVQSVYLIIIECPCSIHVVWPGTCNNEYHSKHFAHFCTFMFHITRKLRVRCP